MQMDYLFKKTYMMGNLLCTIKINRMKVYRSVFNGAASLCIVLTSSGQNIHYAPG